MKTIAITTKVTPNWQIYFINKLLEENFAEGTEWKES